MRVLSLHPDQVLFSLYRGPLMRCDAAADEAAAKAASEAKAKEEADKKAKAEAEKGDDFNKRLSDLDEKNKDLKKKLKEFEDAKKKSEDDKLLEEGKIKEVLTKKEQDLEKLTGEHGTAKQQLAAYEKVLGDQLKKNLDAIKDEKKKATVEKLLEGKSLADKVAILPELLETIGVAAPSGFGGPTPAGGTQPAALEAEQMQKRFNELLAKRDMTPKERTEFYKLKNDLQKVWEKKKETPTV